MKPATVADATRRLTSENAYGITAIETTARTAPAATACAPPMTDGLASTSTVPPSTVAKASASPIGAQQRQRKPPRSPGRHDRLGGTVGLDHIADQDADQQRDTQLALGHREAQREGLGHAIDEDAGRDRLAARGAVSRPCRYRHRHPGCRRVAGAPHRLHLLVAGQPAIGADIHERADYQAQRGDQGPRVAVRVRDQLERDRRQQDAAAESRHKGGHPLRQPEQRGDGAAGDQARRDDQSQADGGAEVSHGRGTLRRVAHRRHTPGKA
jgi:hypothetical protein